MGRSKGKLPRRKKYIRKEKVKVMEKVETMEISK